MSVDLVTVVPLLRFVSRVLLGRSAHRVSLRMVIGNSRLHGASEPWWIWVEDPENEHIYHAELYHLRAEHVRSKVETERNQTLTFTIPIFEPLPTQYYVRAVSDRWLGAEAVEPISFQHLILPSVRRSSSSPK